MRGRQVQAYTGRMYLKRPDGTQGPEIELNGEFITTESMELLVNDWREEVERLRKALGAMLDAFYSVDAWDKERREANKLAHDTYYKSDPKPTL